MKQALLDAAAAACYATGVPGHEPPPLEPLWLKLRGVLIRAPLLAPLAVVCCSIHGGVWCWAAVAVQLAVLLGLGMRRVALCAVLCGLVAWLTRAEQQSREAELLSLLERHGAVELRGVVVQRLARGCVVQTPWPGLRLAVQGDVAWDVADEVRLTAELFPPEPPPVPGMFSTEAWMRGQGISARLMLLHGETCGRDRGWWRLVRWAADMRAALAARLMPPGTQADPRRQTLCALLLGEKSLAEADTMEIFRRGGCLHVFAVSGLHVGLLAGVLAVLLRLLRVPPAVQRWALLLVVGLYVLVTGLAAPALRAYLLLAVVLFGLILRRRSSMLSAWSFAALLLLLLRPVQLYQVGFQLSFVIYAVISLGVVYGMGGPLLLGPDPYIPVRLYTRADRFRVAAETAVRGVALVSVCAWFASLPFGIAYFHVLTPTSYLTNIAITPLLPLAMCCGMLALLLGSLPLVGAACHWLAVQSAGALIAVVSFMSSYPGAYLPTQPPAAADATLLVPLRYGRSFAVLGNPGVLIGDLSRESSARHEIEPAVFHAGYRPALVYGATGAALRFYRSRWPWVHTPEPRHGGCSTWTTAAGSYTFYYPAPPLPATAPPVIVWVQPSGFRVIYVGNAASTLLESLPPEQRQADLLILGRHAHDPVDEAELLKTFNLGEIRHLPGG